jgi:hypothetical protein
MLVEVAAVVFVSAVLRQGNGRPANKCPVTTAQQGGEASRRKNKRNDKRTNSSEKHQMHLRHKRLQQQNSLIQMRRSSTEATRPDGVDSVPESLTVDVVCRALRLHVVLPRLHRDRWSVYTRTNRNSYEEKKRPCALYCHYS